MPARMNIPITQDPYLLHTDRVFVEIDSVQQRDMIRIWPGFRAQRGFGFGSGAGNLGGGFGVWSLTPPEIPFGLGLFGQGAGRVDWKTLASFVAGDYLVRLRSSDQLPPTPGNLSDWTELHTIPHRPKPAKVTQVRVVDGHILANWADG